MRAPMLPDIVHGVPHTLLSRDTQVAVQHGQELVEFILDQTDVG